MQGARVWQSPSKYLQHSGLIKDVGQLVKSTFPKVQRAGIVISKRSRTTDAGTQLIGSLKSPLVMEFEQECHRTAVNELADLCAKEKVDHIVSFGGGKIIDVGKLVADKLDAKSIVVPSVASTDAPCTALSVLYHPDGTFDEYVFFSKSPDMVIVDTDVIFDSPLRFTVSGMGDAMATYYEARACHNNRKASSLIAPFTYRPPEMGLAIAKQCCDILFADAEEAIAGVNRKQMNEAFENVVEAGILMSGLGAESGGLAVAHAIHNALAELPETHKSMHGEKVAFGTICQLIMEGDMAEARRVHAFNKKVGLPTQLRDMNIKDINKDKLDLLAKFTLGEGSTAWNLGSHLTESMVVSAIITADHLADQGVVLKS